MNSANKIIAWQRIEAYRDFYDVPRAFIVQPKAELLLFFNCAFDDASDDYSPFFRVSVLAPGVTLANLPRDWRELNSLGAGAVGVVPVSGVRFDATRRKEVFVEGLADLVAASERLVPSRAG